MMPIVDGLQVEFEGQLYVVQLNAAEPANAALQAQYGLRGHPTFAILDAEGNVSQTFIGPQPVEILRAAMAAVRP